jgi:hypothetical protein
MREIKPDFKGSLENAHHEKLKGFKQKINPKIEQFPANAVDLLNPEIEGNVREKRFA